LVRKSTFYQGFNVIGIKSQICLFLSNTSLALIVKVTFFEPDPKTKDIESRPHSRLDMLYVACRTILTILSIVLIDVNDIEERKQWILTVACVFCSAIMAFGYIWYIPYYNYKYSLWRAGMMLNWFWASLCMLYCVIRPFSDIGIVYIIMVPVVFFLGQVVVSYRRKVIEKLNIGSISDPYTLELKIRFRLEEKNILFREPVTGLGETKTNGMDAGMGASITGGAGQADQERVFLDEINDLFVQGARHMPKSVMLQLFMGAFQLIHLGNRAQCLAIHTKAATMNPKLDEAFMIYRRQRLLNERFAGGDVIDFIAFEQNLQLAKKNEKRATVAVVQFWSELLKPHPSFRKLQLYGGTISSAVSLAQTHYLNLIKLSPDAPHVFRLYGSFLIYVLNDVKQGQDLIDHADEMEEEQRQENADDDDDEDSGGGRSMKASAHLDLFSEDNGLITISGELHNLGVVSDMCQNKLHSLLIF
jgi:hypothetical protein